MKIIALHCITCGHVYYRNKMPKTTRSNSMSNMPQITTLMISNHSYRFVTSQGLYLPRLDVSYCKWQLALMDRGFFFRGFISHSFNNNIIHDCICPCVDPFRALGSHGSLSTILEVKTDSRVSHNHNKRKSVRVFSAKGFRHLTPCFTFSKSHYTLRSCHTYQQTAKTSILFRMLTM